MSKLIWSKRGCLSVRVLSNTWRRCIVGNVGCSVQFEPDHRSVYLCLCAIIFFSLFFFLNRLSQVPLLFKISNVSFHAFLLTHRKIPPKLINLATWNYFGRSWMNIFFDSEKPYYLQKHALFQKLPKITSWKENCLYKVLWPPPFMIRVDTLLQASCPFCSVPASIHLEGEE